LRPQDWIIWYVTIGIVWFLWNAQSNFARSLRHAAAERGWPMIDVIGQLLGIAAAVLFWPAAMLIMVVVMLQDLWRGGDE
jgi:hypothetical protein